MNDMMELTQEALTLVMLLAAPPVVVAALVGLLIAFVQAATQLQEQSFQYAVKFFAVVITIFVPAAELPPAQRQSKALPKRRQLPGVLPTA